ncbi:hypothetical protein AX16_008102 [Volvariella volvacea WC 439]|nr:hypothetical protein AX16_008102 [Volvariella volvacea WC 439]
MAEPMRQAPPPFNRHDSDLVLRTADNVEFLVHKHFLSYNSPFFRDMFTLEQVNTDQEMQGNRPVITLEEDAETIEPLLRYCYPAWLGRPTLRDIDEIIRILSAAQKYDMDGIEQILRAQMVAEPCISVDPLRVYCLAIFYKLDEETRMAAKRLLETPLSELVSVDEMELIRGGDYFRLVKYHEACAEAAQRAIANLTWLDFEASFVWLRCTTCGNGNGRGRSILFQHNRQRWVFSTWWLEFRDELIQKLSKAPCRKTACDEELLERTLSRAARCGECTRGGAPADLRLFTDLLAEEVERVTNLIPLEVVFRY